MNIYLMDGLNGITNIVDAYESIIWNNQYWGKSEFQLTVAGTDENVAKLQKKKLLVRDIDCSKNEYHNVMQIQKTSHQYDVEKGWQLTVSGTGLKNITKQRIIINQTTLSGKVEPLIRQIIIDNIIDPVDTNRKINNFILDAEAGLSDEFEATDDQVFGQYVSEWVESVCQKYSCGWDVYIKNGKYVFKLYRGADRTYNQNENVPVVFSPEFDNLLSSTYESDITEYKNAGVVGGEGEGSAQRMKTVGVASGLDRYEMYIDGSSVSGNGQIITLDQYMNMLESFGNEELVKTQNETDKVEGELIANGMYKLNQDFFLGDLVQVKNQDYMSAKSRIIEIIYSEDSNGKTIIPTFSDFVS